jgi:hypothetical protein
MSSSPTPSSSIASAVKGEWQSEAVYALLAREWHGVTKPTAPS